MTVYSSEEFCRRLERRIRISSISVILLLTITSTIFQTILYLLHAPSIVYITVIVPIVVTIFVTPLLIPTRIEITQNNELIVHALILRKANYGKILHIEKPTHIPDIVCPTGNRGFYGYWAWCSSPEGTVILISEKKCRYLYKIKTEKHTIYLCTSNEIIH